MSTKSTFWTPQQAAQHWGVSSKWVYMHAAFGWIVHFRTASNRIRIPRTDRPIYTEAWQAHRVASQQQQARRRVFTKRDQCREAGIALGRFGSSRGETVQVPVG